MYTHALDNKRLTFSFIHDKVNGIGYPRLAAVCRH